MKNAPLWVFGYGSLMWHPGFDTDEQALARLHGYARTFCMRSIHHRGTPEEPGLVLALDRNAAAVCDGLALRVRSGAEAETLNYLRERELISSAYLEVTETIILADGREVNAVTFVVDTAHDQYCRDVTLFEQARIIARAVGGRGANTEYLFNTVSHMAELGIRDSELEWLVDEVTRLTVEHD
jgi:cation transport protein ChaC